MCSLPTRMRPGSWRPDGPHLPCLKLSSSVVFMPPNVAAMGKIDLDDTDHVVASANLISVAQKAGTFVRACRCQRHRPGCLLQRRHRIGPHGGRPEPTCTAPTPLRRTTTVRPTLPSAMSASWCHRPGLLQHPADQKFSVEDSIHFLSDRAHRQDGQCKNSSVPGERHRRSEHRHYRVDRF